MSGSIKKLMATALLVLSATSVQSEILNVPGDHATIQAAITAASAGDTINVAAGTYVETIEISKDNLTIQSVSRDPEDTIIDANGADINVVNIIDCSGVTISGFTIKNAVGEGYVSGVYMENVSECSLSDSVITAISTSGSDAIGIKLVNATDNNFSSIVISNIFSSGYNSAGGVRLNSANGNSFSSIAISDIEAYNVDGVHIMGSENSFESTTISNLIATGTANGLYLITDSSLNSFSDTEISNLTGGPSYQSARGIFLWSANTNTFTSTEISHLTAMYRAGVWLDLNSSHNSFSEYDISDLDYGVYATAGCNNNSFTGGSIKGGKTGAYFKCGDNSIHLSNISGNSLWGVRNTDVVDSFDAINNWWGSYAGAGASDGFRTGATVSENVNIEPFTLGQYGVDTDDDGTCDNIDPDDDGDGASDLEEVSAGTDPLNPASVPPTAPDNLSAFDLDRTSFLVDWDAVNDASSYQIDVDNDNLFVDSIIDNLDVGNVLIKSVTGLSPNSDYYVRVRTVSDGITGPNSAVLGPITTLPEPSLSILSLLLIITVIRKIKNIR